MSSDINPYLPPDPNDPINRISHMKYEAEGMAQQAFHTNMEVHLRWKFESIEEWQSMAETLSVSDNPLHRVNLFRCVQRVDRLIGLMRSDLKGIHKIEGKLLHGQGSPWWGEGDWRDVWVPEGMPEYKGYYTYPCVWTTRDSVWRAEGAELEGAFGKEYCQPDLDKYIAMLPSVVFGHGSGQFRLYNVGGGWVVRDLNAWKQSK